jgi:hypothetical protein
LIPRTISLHNDLRYAENEMKKGIKKTTEPEIEMASVEVMLQKKNGSEFIGKEKLIAKNLYKKVERELNQQNL